MSKRKTGGFPQGTILNGIRSLSAIKDRCRIDEDSGCWVWSMSKSKTGAARAVVVMPWNPKPTNCNAIRAALEFTIESALPSGVRVWPGCGRADCCNPKHALSGTWADWGAWQASRNAWKASPARVRANREIIMKRRKLTDEQVAFIRSSDLPGTELARMFGVSHQLVSSVRTYRYYATSVIRGASVFSLGVPA